MIGWPFENDVYPQGYLLAGEEAERARAGASRNGPASWGQRHGPAVLHHISQFAIAADNVLLPDGSRGKVRTTDLRGAIWRRPQSGDIDHWDPDITGHWMWGSITVPVTWVWGRIRIADNEISFEDAPELCVPVFAGPSAAIERDLYNDPAFGQLLQDIDVAAAAISVLFQGDWYHEDRDEECSFSAFENSAATVADIRRKGETAFDWEGYAGIAKIRSRAFDRMIREHLMRLGWIDERR